MRKGQALAGLNLVAAIAEISNAAGLQAEVETLIDRYIFFDHFSGQLYLVFLVRIPYQLGQNVVIASVQWIELVAADGLRIPRAAIDAAVGPGLAERPLTVSVCPKRC